MRKISMYGILVAVLMAILLTSISIANAYTYDSDIDPKAVREWNMVLMEPFDQYILVGYKNPDIAADILAAIILSKYPGICVGFSYYKNSKVHPFIYNVNTDHYTRVESRNLTKFMKRIFQEILGYIST